MQEIPGYLITDKLYHGQETTIFRGIRLQDDTAVILKTLSLELFPQTESHPLAYEYQILSSIDNPGVVNPIELFEFADTAVLVCKDIGGITWAAYQKQSDGDFVSFLQIAIQLAKILDYLHHQRIIHRDINPHNIIIQPETEHVQLIDFGLASRLIQDEPVVDNPLELKGTLPYLSPEQTGRMNRVVDYRSDFYALGITFFEILTGQLPYPSDDPLELIHSHIARPLPALTAIRSDIPGLLADIVHKLCAKQAEERYQSGFGLQTDLEICLHQWRTSGHLVPFSLGEQDVADQLKIPQKLYGRDVEMNQILNKFRAVANGEKAFMLINGFAGIGKSTLVREIKAPIVRNQGFFISGKFDQYQQIPYEGFILAFQGWIRQVLTLNETEHEFWRERIQQALGKNGRVMTNVLPELEHILGPQPELPQLGPNETQNRFRLVVQSFLEALTSEKERPLVLFLDDLQWMDSASVRVLQNMVTNPDIGYLYLLGAFRNETVTAAHPLDFAIRDLQENGFEIDQIKLTPLDCRTIRQLLADTLKRPLAELSSLAELIDEKTGGNPFFLGQFITTLAEDKLLWFDAAQRRWRWNLSKIREEDYTDNVVSLMSDKLKQLPDASQQLLQRAACLGNTFDVSILTEIYEMSASETGLALWPALQAGLIMQIHDYSSKSSGRLEPPVAYRFVHDRVQEAAYSLLSNKERQQVHYQIGRFLLDQAAPSYFDVVNHLNKARPLLTANAEKIECATLNLKVGKQAVLATANEAAFDYLTIGIDLLPVARWQTHYKLALDLHVAAAEAAYLSAQFREMEPYATAVLAEATETLDKIRIYEIRIQAAITQNDPATAVEIALEALQLLDIKLPKNPGLLHVGLGLMRTKAILFRKSIPELIHLPKMTDPQAIAAMRVLGSVGTAAYLASPELLPLIVFEQVNISVRHGMTAVSADAFATYGLILTGFLSDFDGGYQSGQLALNLLDKYEAKEFEARTVAQFEATIHHWKVPLQQTTRPLLSAYQTALETGDMEFTGFVPIVYAMHAFFLGKPLAHLTRELSDYIATFEHLNLGTSVHWANIFRQTFHNLQDGVEHPYQLNGDFFDEVEVLGQLQAANDGTALSYYYICKLMLCTWFGVYDTAVIASDAAAPHLESVLGLFISVQHAFFDSLARLGNYSASDPAAQKKILKRIRANLKKMKKWAKIAPFNHAHRRELVAAEVARVRNETTNAANAYDLAIGLARENGFPQDVALAQEKAGYFWLAQGNEKMGLALLAEALEGFRVWGARAKVNQLLTAVPALKYRSVPTVVSPSQPNSTTLESTAVYDLATILKASQTISEEILFDKLLQKLMQFLMENAGAQRSVLIMAQEEKWIVQAVADIETPDVRLLPNCPFEDYRGVAHAVVNYVRRMGEPFVLDDAAHSTTLVDDPYIQENKPKSILCLPLIRQSRLIGLIYLENNLTVGAFTPERLQLLNLLSGQIAISLENARLYQNMSDEIAERNRVTEELRQKEKQLQLLLEQMPAILWTTDRSLRFTSSLGGGLSLINLEADEVVNQTLFDFFGTEDETFLPIQYQRRALAGERVSFEFEWSGQPFQVYLEPLESGSGEIIGSIGVAVDMTDRKEAEYKLRAYNQLLQRSNRELQEFTFVASHDLQEPLRKIQTFSDLLAIKFKSDLDSKSLDYLKRIQVSAGRVQVLIESLLAFSLVTSQERPFELVDLNDVVHTVITEMAGQIMQVKALVNVGQLPTIEADSTQMNQLIYHLLNNALVYQPNGQRPVVSVQSKLIEQHGLDYCELWVTDNGIGFDEKYVGRIFNVFQRLHGRTEYRGVGVGLAICRKIAERHHGTITAESQPGSGAKFIVTLPVSQSNLGDR